MSLKAGRVGVAPSEVDEFGQIVGEITPTNVYTKSQSDNKFETKSHASASYQAIVTKSIGVVSTEFTEDSYRPTQVTKLNFGSFSLIELDLNVTGVTATAWDTTVATVPEGYRPLFNLIASGNAINVQISSTDGAVKVGSNITDNTVRLHVCYII